MMHLQAKEDQRMTWSQEKPDERHGAHPPSEPLGGTNSANKHPDFKLLVSISERIGIWGFFGCFGGVVFWFVFVFVFVFVLLYRATLMACGSSQARGQIGATVTGLYHSHSNTGSEPRL